MVQFTARAQFLAWRGCGGALLALVIVALGGPGVSGAPLARPAGRPAQALQAASVLTPPQDFQDVPTNSPFYGYLHNLGGAGVVGGYGCGGPGEPCVPPANLPYYRPGNAVTRLQMTKFIDLGRRNIADAVGTSLVISASLSGMALDAQVAGGIAVSARCFTPNSSCAGVQSVAPAGGYAANLVGGQGTATYSSDANAPGLDASADGTAAYGVKGESTNYRGGYFKSDNMSYSLYVDTVGGPNQGTAGLDVNGALRVEGNLSVLGSKSGYVVDLMQNVDSVPLAPGDLVVIAGSSAPVLGQIPIVTVRKATRADDTAVAGVVDQVMYVPDAATAAAYAAQEAAIHAALDRRAAAQVAARAGGGQPAPVAAPAATISDADGTPHALPAALSVAPGGYLNVVTLGAYKAVRVDASFGAIGAGDLLTTSPHAGYAMKVTDKMAAMGAVIGKALTALATGTGSIPVLVSLK